MSWDIFVQRFPSNVKALADIPGDFEPSIIGKRSDIIATIQEVAPAAEFSDPAWGRITGEGWSIEVNLGKDEECEGFAFHHGCSACGVRRR